MSETSWIVSLLVAMVAIIIHYVLNPNILHICEYGLQVATPDILNCNESRSFWVSWSLGDIKVGRGDIVDDQTIMRWVDPQPLAVGIVALSTGLSFEGVWRLSTAKC
jgi:hypothetical protein